MQVAQKDGGTDAVAMILDSSLRNWGELVDQLESDVNNAVMEALLLAESNHQMALTVALVNELKKGAAAVKMSAIAMS